MSGTGDAAILGIIVPLVFLLHAFNAVLYSALSLRATVVYSDSAGGHAFAYFLIYLLGVLRSIGVFYSRLMGSTSQSNEKERKPWLFAFNTASLVCMIISMITFPFFGYFSFALSILSIVFEVVDLFVRFKK